MTKLVRRPAHWALLAVAVALGLTFGYFIPLAGVTGAAQGVPNSERGLDAILPGELVGNSLGGLPVFLGAILLVLGALAIGGEYGWGTWKTVLTQNPSRLAVLGGKLAALAAAALGFVVTLFVTGAVTSAAIAAAEGEPIAWPSAADLVVGLGAGWLIALMWAALGALLAVALRGLALPIGLGLVWVLVVQNLVISLAAPLLGWVDAARLWLPGDNAGSLAASLGAQADTPGVAELAGSGRATLMVAAYACVFAGLAAWLLRRRDVL
ncbi:ABC transporter permease subunit [Streptomyces sp. TR06-5]|uniref:ABC transporter permease subunit n=1 Tax=unclassified Streptomyces TaxID=2593676 RepID=UPI0039A24304